MSHLNLKGVAKLFKGERSHKKDLRCVLASCHTINSIWRLKMPPYRPTLDFNNSKRSHVIFQIVELFLVFSFVPMFLIFELKSVLLP